MNLEQCPLFLHVDIAFVHQMIQQGTAYSKQYQKNEYLYHQGDPISALGIVIEGTIQIIKQDYLGNNTIIASIGENELFAESFAMSASPLQVDIKAESSCKILWIPMHSILNISTNHVDQQIMLQNLLQILSNKNLYLTKRIDVLSQRSTKEKVMTFLHQQAQLQHSEEIVLSMNRQELADYLCVERSALSTILTMLKQEGMITYHKNTFYLHSHAS